MPGDGRTTAAIVTVAAAAGADAASGVAVADDTLAAVNERSATKACASSEPAAVALGASGTLTCVAVCCGCKAGTCAAAGVAPSGTTAATEVGLGVLAVQAAA